MNRKNNNLKVTKDPFYYYRWEFLRRNESYKKDYDAFINEKNETKKKELRKDITARSGLFSPADYRTNYPDFAQSVEKSGNDSKGRAEKHVIKVSELPEAIVFTQQFRPSSILRTDAWSKQALSEKFSLQNSYIFLLTR